jgi:xylose isomerase
MHTYLVLKDKVRRFGEDKEIQALLSEIREDDAHLSGLCRKFSKDGARALLAADLDRKTLASRRLPYERLDQLVIDLLLGVR